MSVTQSELEIWRYQEPLKAWQWRGPHDREQPLADSQQENRDLSPTTTRIWILPTIWMSLEEALSLRYGNSLSQHLDFNLSGPWTEKWGRLCWTPDLQKVWDNNLCCFKMLNFCCSPAIENHIPYLKYQ